MTVTGPLLPVVAEEFAVTVGDAGIIVTAFAVPYGVCQILFGPIGDRYGKLRVIAIALGSSTLFVLGSGLAQSLGGLAVMRFCSGLAMAATIPLAMAWIADEVPYVERQPVIGRFVNGLVLGQMAGGIFGGLAAEYFEWRSIFYLFALFCAGFSLLLWRLDRRSATRPAPVHASPRQVIALYWSLLTQARARRVIVAGAVEGMIVFGVLAYFGAFLRQEHDLGYGLIGLVLCMYGLGGLVYAAAVYRLVPLLGERRMILLGTVLLGACYVALTRVPHWGLCAPVLLLAGFGFYLFHNTMQTRATELSDAARGTAMSLWVFMVFFGQGIGVWVCGALVDRHGYDLTFTFAGGAVVLLGWWFQAGPAPHPQAPSPRGRSPADEPG